MEFGSKEHTQFAYNEMKRISGNDTQTIIEFINYLKSIGKLEQLQDMKDLTIFERTLIEDKLKK